MVKKKHLCQDCKTWIGFRSKNAKRYKTCQETHRFANYQSEQFKARKRAYSQKWYQENKARKRAYSQKWYQENKARMRAYNQKPEVKARMRAYNQKPEVKARMRAYGQKYSKIRSRLANERAEAMLKAEIARLHKENKKEI